MDVLSVSYGACEHDVGEAETTFYANVWAQAAAQGMSAMVASGDSGVAGCQSGSDATGTIAGVNGLGSSPYVTCVGGTQFLDTGDPSKYWNPTNDPTTKKSVKGYIPEAPWNESGTMPGGSALWGTGGGSSLVFARPPWQNVSGLPADNARWVPDVALAAAVNTRRISSCKGIRPARPESRA